VFFVLLLWLHIKRPSAIDSTLIRKTKYRSKYKFLIFNYVFKYIEFFLKFEYISYTPSAVTPKRNEKKSV